MEASPFKFQDTTATRKVFSLKKRIRAVRGGTSASKTISILVWLIDYAQSTKGEILSVVSETFPHLEDGAMRDFEAIMKDRGYWDDDRWHGTKHEYTFEGGSVIEFLSVDTYGKAHGPRRDVLFINECNNLDWNIVDQLITRTRKVVWLDWNPVSEFWFDTEILPNRDDVDFITLTYLDNEALDAVSLAEILSHKNNKRWWTVYGLGQVGDIEGRIFTGWQVNVDDIPHEARLERYGLDFGYTNDPTALIAIYYYNGGYILDEVLYQKGLSNKQIADVILNQPRKAMVIADSAEPKSIDEIRSHGINIMPTTKGPGSVLQRIQMMQDQQISVTKRSVNTISEYRKYLWETDKEGRITNEPSPIFNHAMDAAGYALRSLVPMIQRADMLANMPRYEQRKRTNTAR
jgi:phage terminase large subunit